MNDDEMRDVVRSEDMLTSDEATMQLTQLLFGLREQPVDSLSTTPY